MKEQFYGDVALIEDEAKRFIDASFKTLRSAEGAFEMLLNFKHIRSRDSINSQMMRKFNDILAQFDKEVVRFLAVNRHSFYCAPSDSQTDGILCDS